MGVNKRLFTSCSRLSKKGQKRLIFSLNGSNPSSARRIVYVIYLAAFFWYLQSAGRSSPDAERRPDSGQGSWSMSTCRPVDHDLPARAHDATWLTRL
jgi:hypothetical protein